MTCAMRSHDPCAGEVRTKDINGHHVPLCWRHVIQWHKRAAPFATMAEPEKMAKWAKWAADRARRQGAGERPMQRVTVTP